MLTGYEWGAYLPGARAVGYDEADDNTCILSERMSNCAVEVSGTEDSEHDVRDPEVEVSLHRDRDHS